MTAFSRSAASVKLTHNRLTRFSGDALNGADVGHAVADADTVIQALGVPANVKLVIGTVTLFSLATSSYRPPRSIDTARP